MNKWQADVVVTIHDTEIPLIVVGTPMMTDTGEPSGWNLEGAHLCWADKTPVQDAVLGIIGNTQKEAALVYAEERLQEEGPRELDPDDQRATRQGAA